MSRIAVIQQQSIAKYRLRLGSSGSRLNSSAQLNSGAQLNLSARLSSDIQLNSASRLLRSSDQQELANWLAHIGSQLQPLTVRLISEVPSAEFSQTGSNVEFSKIGRNEECIQTDSDNESDADTYGIFSMKIKTTLDCYNGENQEQIINELVSVIQHAVQQSTNIIENLSIISTVLYNVTHQHLGENPTVPHIRMIAEALIQDHIDDPPDNIDIRRDFNRNQRKEDSEREDADDCSSIAIFEMRPQQPDVSQAINNHLDLVRMLQGLLCGVSTDTIQMLVSILQIEFVESIFSDYTFEDLNELMLLVQRVLACFASRNCNFIAEAMDTLLKKAEFVKSRTTDLYLSVSTKGRLDTDEVASIHMGESAKFISEAEEECRSTLSHYFSDGMLSGFEDLPEGLTVIEQYEISQHREYILSTVRDKLNALLSGLHTMQKKM